MGKEKKEKCRSEGGDETETNDKESRWRDLITRVSPIASPLASRKMSKKIYKAIKKAAREKKLRKGVREIQKCIRKGEKGFVVIAGDTTPIEVVCHMPVVCEESNTPYCYTPSKEDLGAAFGTRRSACILMVKDDESYHDLYAECHEDLKSLPLPI